jgi:hypothetical protein
MRLSMFRCQQRLAGALARLPSREREVMQLLQQEITPAVATSREVA